MKKILFFAATCLALASACQRENLEPENALVANEGELICTIDDITTKTVIDNLGEDAYTIKWKDADRILVFDKIYDDKTYLASFYHITANNNTSATFAYDWGVAESYVASEQEWIEPSDYKVAYYPYIHQGSENSTCSTDVVLDDDTLSGITLASEQTYEAGTFTSGSFPMVAIAEAGSKNLAFKNILGGIILNMKGTDAIKSIKLEGATAETNPLAGPVTVTVPVSGEPSIAFAEEGKVYSVTLNCNSVQLNAETATPFILLVPPTTFAEGIKITVTDVNDVVRTATNSTPNTVTASNFLKFDLTYDNGLVFKLADEAVSTQYAPAQGGEIKLGVQTNLESTEWSVKETLPSWITAAPATKASEVKDLYLTVAKNTTGATREQNITFVVNEVEVFTYKVIQRSYDPALIVEGQTWDESFGYDEGNKAAGATSESSKKMTIALNEGDPAKGTYIISGMLGMPNYAGVIGYGTYYADLEGDKLTIYSENAAHVANDARPLATDKTSDFVLTVSEDKKTITGPAVSDFTFFVAEYYIFNYTATVYEEPEVSGDSPFAGTWDQTFSVSYGTAATEMTIVENGDGTVTLTNFIYEGTSMTGTVTGDNQITIAGGTFVTGSTGPLDADVVLTLADGKLTTADFVIATWINVTSYTATKQEAAPSLAEQVAGTYSQSVPGMGWPSPSATMTITANADDTITIVDFITEGTEITVSFVDNTFVVQSGTSIKSAGPIDSNVTFTISDDRTTITAGAFSMGGWINATGYSATKQ